MEHRVNRIHERTLRLICPDQHQLTFKELLENKTRLSAYTREIYKSLQLTFIKTKNKVSSEVVNSLFEFSNKNCNLRNASILKRKRYFIVHYGNESLLSLAPKMWELVPD